MKSINKAVKILHTPNHRGVKGTEYIINSIQELQNEGLKIDLILIENKPNSYVKGELENTDILVDEDILLFEKSTREKYPEKLRRVVVYDRKNDITFELITNNFSWTAYTISEIYRRRWDIETFFKELKSSLKIKSFVGTSENAVMIQIWTALISYLILRYLKQIARYGWSLSNLVAALRGCLFLKIDLRGFLDEPFKPPGELITDGKQEMLFAQ